MSEAVKTKRKYTRKTKVESTEPVIEQPKKIYTPYELFGNELGISGWSGLIEPLTRKINNFNKEKDENSRILITQIKEKFGSLRYYGFFTEEIQKQVDMAEEASNHICEHCGSVFSVGKYQEGWIETVCRNCAISENKYGYNYEYIFSIGTKGQDDYKTYHIYSDKKDYDEAFQKAVERVSNDKDPKIRCINLNFESFCKYPLWKEYYHSVYMDGIIRFALKIQKIVNWIKKIYDRVQYKIWYFWKFKVNNKRNKSNKK